MTPRTEPQSIIKRRESLIRIAPIKRVRISRTSSLWIFRKYIVPTLHNGVACRSALGIISLGWLIRGIGGPKTVGGSFIFEGSIPPAAAIRKSLAVLHHQVHIVECAGYERLSGIGFLLLRYPMNLRHLGAIGEGLAVLWNA